MNLSVSEDKSIYLEPQFEGKSKQWGYNAIQVISVTESAMNFQSGGHRSWGR